MNLLAEKLENKLHSIAQKYYADFSQIAVAVSGGADSLALIFLLNELKQKYPCSIKVLTVNHHLRPEADGEAKYVQNLMKSWGLEHYVLNWFPEDISSESPPRFLPPPAQKSCSDSESDARTTAQ